MNRLGGARGNTRTAAGAFIRVQHRVGNTAQHGFEADGLVLATLAANTALHPALSQAGSGKLRLPSPRQAVCDAVQRMGSTSL